MGNLVCQARYDPTIIEQLIQDVKHLSKCVANCMKEVESVKASVNSRPSSPPPGPVTPESLRRKSF